MFKATATKYKVDLDREMDCDTRNIVYAIHYNVDQCGKQYVGQTSKILRERFSQHCYYVDRNVEATGIHFNLPGHHKSYMSVTVVEKNHSQNV